MIVMLYELDGIAICFSEAANIPSYSNKFLCDLARYLAQQLQKEEERDGCALDGLLCATVANCLESNTLSFTLFSRSKEKTRRQRLKSRKRMSFYFMTTGQKVSESGSFI